MSRERTLGDVRADIDAIDDAIHDLLIRRTELVEEVRSIKSGWRVKIQPSREAEIVYRLLARHRGPFPKRDLIAIWRILICATLSFEGPFSVAVFTPESEQGYWDVARSHFGPYTPMSRHGSARTVIEVVTRQEATVGVVPMPHSDDPNPWWRHIAADRPDAPKIIGRLPFAVPGTARGPAVDALVLCPVTVTATGRDRSFLLVDTPRRIPLVEVTRALKGAGLDCTLLAPWSDKGTPPAWLYLAEVDGWLGADDARLEQFRHGLGQPVDRLLLLGGYARPLTAETLDQPATAVLPAPADEDATAG